VPRSPSLRSRCLLSIRIASEPESLEEVLEKNHTAAVQSNYDLVAKEYANHLFDELSHKPLDRELLDRFAKGVKGRGDACDLGCGPGQVARYLRDAGAEVFGLDVSEGMLEEARRLNPDIAFRSGDMLALDLPEASLAGIAAFYAIVHMAPTSLPLLFSELHRVLQPNGLLLLAFHIGHETVHRDELWGVRVSLDFVFFRVEDVTQALSAADFEIEEMIEREPYPDVEYPSQRAYVVARKTIGRT
jgi:SAM-dependent methyltransferase